MARILKERFMRSLEPLNFFLVLTGIYICPLSSLSRRKKFVARFWSVFFLVLCFQSSTYIVVKRSCLFYRFISCPQWFENFTVSLTNGLIRAGQLLSDTIIHVYLLLTIKTTMTTFLQSLENIDNIFERPSLMSIQRFSLLGTIYLIITIYLNLYFNFFWELLHPIRKFNWFDSIQNGIKVFGNQWFTALPSWIFFICGQLVVLYFKDTKNHLTILLKHRRSHDDKGRVTSDILNTLRCIKQLNGAVVFLHQRFSTMLLATCFITAITLLSSAFFLLRSASKITYVWGNLWEATDVIDSLIRFWMLGYISDRMRQAASECIPVLRKIRDEFVGIETLSPIHHKITLFIVEAATIHKDVDRLSLYGLFPLTKHLTMKVAETVVTFLIILFQSQ